jgi:hypothetical protein
MSEDEIQARIDLVLGQIFETVEANKQVLDVKLLRLLGLMSVEFNILERDFKYLLILLLDDIPLSDALDEGRERALFQRWGRSPGRSQNPTHCHLHPQT